MHPGILDQLLHERAQIFERARSQCGRARPQPPDPSEARTKLADARFESEHHPSPLRPRQTVGEQPQGSEQQAKEVSKGTEGAHARTIAENEASADPPLM